ncbi:matrix metalloproteinase-14-like isoform X2 [Liolophura sinensis]|uniref:matrix metalloproteinase-14-like isoform X2 n=1 Tax=Liolophura sinensis TaxID=3198878 RepID=UPI003158E299
MGYEDTLDLIPDYLVKYGYLKPQDPRTGALRTEESYREGLKIFQEFAGLNITGVLDSETMTMMQMPRCGVADEIGNGLRVRRRRRYTIQGSKWRKSPLTYKITTYTQKLTRQQVDDAVERAFKVWSDVSQLQFRKTTGTPDFEIYFARASHGDGNPFDGAGKTLAHAFFPQFGGDAHFDDDERWTVGTSRGVDLFQVAAHEFGHSLGLSHSQVRSALMAPFYRGYQENFELDQDDVVAIQTLYGTRRQSTTRTPVTQPPTRIRPVSGGGVTVNTLPRDISAICRNSKIDAITRTKDGLTYVFAGRNYYRLNNEGVDPGYPRRISWDWKGVEGPIDAAITLLEGRTYLFKGSQYWRFENQREAPGYPRYISQGFRGLPDNLDAAFTWSGNGQAYFIKGSNYYKYAFRTSASGVAPGYPRALRNWRGLPTTIDAAFKWENGRTYFFSGQDYYRFNDKMFLVDSGYPRNNSHWWFGCSGVRPSQPQGQAPNDAKNDIHEADMDADQYDGPVLAHYPDNQNGTNTAIYPNSAQPITANFILTSLLAVVLLALWS